MGFGVWGAGVVGKGLGFGGVDEERGRVALLISFRRPTLFLIPTPKTITRSHPEGSESLPETSPYEM